MKSIEKKIVAVVFILFVKIAYAGKEDERSFVCDQELVEKTMKTPVKKGPGRPRKAQPVVFPETPTARSPAILYSLPAQNEFDTLAEEAYYTLRVFAETPPEQFISRLLSFIDKDKMSSFIVKLSSESAPHAIRQYDAFRRALPFPSPVQIQDMCGLDITFNPRVPPTKNPDFTPYAQAFEYLESYLNINAVLYKISEADCAWAKKMLEGAPKDSSKAKNKERASNFLTTFVRWKETHVIPEPYFPDEPRSQRLCRRHRGPIPFAEEQDFMDFVLSQ